MSKRLILPLGALLLAGTLVAPEANAARYTDEADSLYAVAGALYVDGRYRDAIPVFLRVIELDPGRGNAHALLGGAYLQVGDYANAIGSFERALKLDEGIKLAYLGLVAANYFTERIEAAEGWVDRLIPILSQEEQSRYLARLSTQFPRIRLPRVPS